MTSDPGPLRLFEGFGVELEYMIVDRESLDICPVADEVLRSAAGEIVSEVEIDDIAWSNELVLHLIELKTNGPAQRLEGLHESFQRSVTRINAFLEDLDCALLPSGMHPWMDPARETRLWPHEYDVVYETFNRIFDCSGHGWANLQSVHLNLPFGDDETAESEFARLHAAIRLLLPVLPALAASSPILEGRATGTADSRLSAYVANARRIPSVTGQVIPEPVFTRSGYERDVLGTIYRDLLPHDPEGVLRHEWVNARGAIPRFDRNTIEIRVLDVQECPRADVAIAALVSEALRALIAERWSPLQDQQAWPAQPLADIFRDTVQYAEEAEIRDQRYLDAFGIRPGKCLRACELWHHIMDAVWPPGSPQGEPFAEPLQTILNRGTLSRRILQALGGDCSRRNLRRVYGRLAESLARAEIFLP